MDSKSDSESVWLKMTPQRERSLWISAIEAGDEGELRALSLAGLRPRDPASLSAKGDRGLAHRAMLKSFKVFDMVLELGADPLVKSDPSMVELMLRGVRYHRDLEETKESAQKMRALANAGVRYDHKINPGVTVWEECLRVCESLASVQTLFPLLEPWVEQGADVNLPLCARLDPDQKGSKIESNSLLLRAMIYGEPADVERLLSWGADPLSEKAGLSALSAAREAFKKWRAQETEPRQREAQNALIVLAAGERAELLLGIGPTPSALRRASL